MPPKERPDAKALDSINADQVEAAPATPDSITAESLERQQLQAQIESLKQDIQERKKYAHRIFCLMCVWLGCCFLILGLNGFSAATRFSLSQPVLLALIGGTTADVLGIFYIVIHYLFWKPDSAYKSAKTKKENS